MRKAVMAAAAAVSATLLWGCNPRVRVDPIKVEPIHVTMDVNVRLDERLDQFFAFEDKIPVQPPGVPNDAAPSPEAGTGHSTEVP